MTDAYQKRLEAWRAGEGRKPRPKGRRGEPYGRIPSRERQLEIAIAAVPRKGGRADA